MPKILPNGVEVFEQDFIDGTLQFGKEAGKMIFDKIDAKGGHAHKLRLNDIKFTDEELLLIENSKKNKNTTSKC